MHREIEAAAELLHRLDRFETFPRLCGQRFGLHQQIGVSLMVRASDAAAQLVQLRQAEAVGTVHQDGVGGRHIDAGLDDRGAQQHIETLLVKVAHHRFEFALVHLPVRDADARLGQQRGQLLRHIGDGLHLVVQEINLPAALQFAQHRLADDAVAGLRDEGLDRQPALRRGGDDRKIAQAFQRHRQCARDRRRGQCQHIHFGAQCLEAFLLLHAEAVLFVDDDQAEVVELHALLDQLVRADDDVELAVGHVFQRLGLLLGGAEARQLGDLDRQVGEAVGEILEMLLGQQRGGHQHRDLFAVHRRDEGGAQRDLGLAEADVAAAGPSVCRIAGRRSPPRSWRPGPVSPRNRTRQRTPHSHAASA